MGCGATKNDSDETPVTSVGVKSNQRFLDGDRSAPDALKTDVREKKEHYTASDKTRQHEKERGTGIAAVKFREDNENERNDRVKERERLRDRDKTRGSSTSVAVIEREEKREFHTQGEYRVPVNYIVDKETLGKGHFAKVKKCHDRRSGEEYALKIMEKKDMVKSTAIVRAEIDILMRVGRHPHIVGLIDHFEDDSRFYLVMEYAAGGDLFSKIVDNGKYSEQQAARACRQLASALLHIHKCGVVHRDLKPENILLTSNDIDADIKVADFGLSKLMKDDQHYMRTVCGTWAYCAPEVITRKPYSKLVDNWTLGVLMFILLSGYHPFDVYGDLPEADLLKKIVANSFDFDDPVWEHISDDAKSLIKRLLQIDPAKRLSLEDYLDHPWVGGSRAKDVPLPHVVDRLSKFNVGRQKFRALVLAKLASAKFKASISKSGFRGGGSGTWNFAAALAAANSGGSANANSGETFLDSSRPGPDRDTETASRRGSGVRGQLLLPPQPGPAPAITLQIPHSSADKERHMREERQDSNGYPMHTDSPPQSRPISVVGINMEASSAVVSSAGTPIVATRAIGDSSSVSGSGSSAVPRSPNLLIGSITRDDVKVELSYKDSTGIGINSFPKEKDKDARPSNSQLHTHRTVFVNAAGTSAQNSAHPSPRQTTP